jgi:uncharacterized membrane protein YqaE (UPF0057 family)
MRLHFLLATVLPPLAVLLTGRWRQALLNVPLTLCGWLPGAVHAVIVVYQRYESESVSGLAMP